MRFAICDLEELFITVGSYVILVPDDFAIWNTICDLEELFFLCIILRDICTSYFAIWNTICDLKIRFEDLKKSEIQIS